MTTIKELDNYMFFTDIYFKSDIYVSVDFTIQLTLKGN